MWIYVPHTTSSTVSAGTADSPSDSDSPTRTPTSGRPPISNGTNTASKSSRPGSQTATSMTLPSGEGTSEPLMASPGVESWILSLQAHHAPVSRSPGTALEERMTEICSRKRSDWLTRYDRLTQSWKMSQVLLWENDPTFGTFSVDFPRSGFMSADGELYPLKPQALHTNGTAGGASLVWMTPNTMDALSAKSQEALDHEHETARPGRSNPNNLRDQVAVSAKQRLWPTAVADGDRQTNYAQGGTALGVAARMFPTPRAGKTIDEDEESWLARHAAGKVATPPLALAARMLPTPNSRDYKDFGPNVNWEPIAKKSKLAGVVQMLPTPSSGGDSGGPHGIRGGSWAKAKLVETFGEEDAVAMSGGSLSPDWVSWLMGLPLGWTSLEPLSQEEYDEWFHAQLDGTWWLEEQGLPRIATGIPDRVNRLKCLGNGIVPASLALFLRG